MVMITTFETTAQTRKRFAAANINHHLLAIDTAPTLSAVATPSINITALNSS